MSQMRKAKVGEPFSISVEGRLFDKFTTDSFEPIYDNEFVDVEQVRMTSLGAIGSICDGYPCLYDYKITPKKKGKSDIKFGIRYCFGFNESYSLEVDVE